MWIEVFTYLLEDRPDGKEKCGNVFVTGDMGVLNMNEEVSVNFPLSFYGEI